MRCKQRLHALAKEFMLEGGQKGRLDPAPRSTRACWTYRVPRSGLVQEIFCGAASYVAFSKGVSLVRSSPVFERHISRLQCLKKS
jgi:hypothetical protein